MTDNESQALRYLVRKMEGGYDYQGLVAAIALLLWGIFNRAVNEYERNGKVNRR